MIFVSCSFFFNANVPVRLNRQNRTWDTSSNCLLALVLQLAAFEFENFRGKKVELSGDCKDVLEKTQRVGSVIVESGP